MTLILQVFLAIFGSDPRNGLKTATCAFCEPGWPAVAPAPSSARTLVCVATRRPWGADRLDPGQGGRQERGDRRAASGWRRPMRLMLIVVTVAVAMLLDLRVSQATQMPWCAGTSTGHAFHYNCSLP